MAVDLGSGSLHDLARWGLPPEPTVRAAIAAGADLVTFSGDKLLGGPQAGLVVGRADARRPAAAPPAEAGAAAGQDRPSPRWSRCCGCRPTRTACRNACPRCGCCCGRGRRSRRWRSGCAPAVAAALQGMAEVAVMPCDSQIGSGARPADLLPSAALALRPLRGRTADALAAALRRLPIPVLGRVARGSVLLDLRCLEEPAAFEAQLPLLPGLLGA